MAAMHQQLIPERDSGPIPRPKPRARTAKPSTKGPSNSFNLLATKSRTENDVDDVISLSSISSASNGFDNRAFTHDEHETPFTITKDRPRKRFSSDSEPDNNNVVQKHVFAADVHDFPTRHKASPERTESEDSIPTKLGSPPKPKPRKKSPYTDSDGSSDSKATVTSQKSLPKPRNRSSGSPKKDHVKILIPPEKDEAVETNNNNNNSEQGKVAESKTGFVRKFKSAAQSFITKVPSTKETFASKKTKMKEQLETHIQIQNLEQSSTENIEMASIPKPSTSSSSAPLDTVETISETKPTSRTKALLKREEDAEIQRLRDTIQSSPSNREVLPQISSPSKRQRRRAEKTEQAEKYFGVTIHSCDLLPIDPNIVHPVVKVTLLNQDGTTISKAMSNLSTPERPSKKREKQDRRKNREKDAETKSSKTAERSKENSHTSKFTKKSILPIMTQPCKLGYYLPTFAPAWNEPLVFEEPFSNLVYPDSMAILFFEVMDFLPAAGPTPVGSKLFGDYHGSEEGWYKVAWGFLKLIGANGARNVNRKIRLQLFKPEHLPSKVKTEGVEVYQWWKLQRRHKINSTLYVTVKAVPPIPATQTASLNKLLSMKKEDLTQALLDSQIASSPAGSSKPRGPSIEVERKLGQTDVRLPQWRRLEGQICKIPNKMLKSLPASPIESLNLTICGNVQCVKFSPCGLKLAAGLDTDELHTIVLFEMPKGKLLSNIRCHHGLIYDLDWKILGEQPTFAPKSYYLASASADMTATVWEVYGSSNPPRLVKKLLHPSFVYCVKIHPTKTNLIFTGCFDYAIRIWDLQKSSPSGANRLNPETESVPLMLLDKHESFVNCLTFDSMGHHLYSGDGTGMVLEWESGSSGRKRSWKVSREMTFRDAGKNPVNALQVHPTGNRLLVHVRHSAIKIVDLGSLLTLHSITGLVNDKLQVRSCFSPCGNLILSGSEDSTLCIWDADTGSVLQFVSPENHGHCVVTCVDYHPHDYYVVIGLASTISEPNPIIVYTHKQAKPTKIHLKTLSKLASLNKSSSMSTEILADDQEVPDPTAKSFGMERGDSSEKFIMIVKKLDAALQVTRKPKLPGVASKLSQVAETTENIQSPVASHMGLQGSGEGPVLIGTKEPRTSDIGSPFKVGRKLRPQEEKVGDEKPVKERGRGSFGFQNLDEPPQGIAEHHSKHQKNITIESYEAESWDSPLKSNTSSTIVQVENKYADVPEKDESSSAGSAQVSKVRQKRRERRRMISSLND